jgi:hypothetical protein
VSHTGIRRFTTKRFLFSAVGLGLATYLCLAGKLSGQEWVYALLSIIAGHHAEDIVARWRGTGAQQ